MMFFGVIVMVAGHGAARHTHRHRCRRLIGMRQMHRAAVQNERQGEDDGKQSSVQADVHRESRAKLRASVYDAVLKYALSSPRSPPLFDV